MARADLPSGTVTFLFTDVEGSTKLLHELGADAYAEALSEHRRVIREACAARGGVEVDTQGDAFFFVFADAPSAVAAASAFTHALASGQVQVRVGLHSGTPLLTDEGYIGDDVHFGARVGASGHGGQILVSSSTAAHLPSDSLSQGHLLLDLGEHRLKDIPEPVSIFQLGEGSFPPLKTISNTNLPRPASSFVGREGELGEVLARIEAGARLLTLTGPGGSGKTRLAIEAAATLVPEYKAGVFWIGLAALRDPVLVPETIAQTLGAKDGLPEYIGERELLLLLDNLEQVVEAAPQLSALLTACPNLTLLVTSRELLRVQGEVEYPVPPLAAPEAVSLFCARSQLEPTEEIAELCRRLDNLPLAVELAAARTKALTPAQILERLSRRLDLFKGGRDADPRQQTLRATIEWSYDLLSEAEQQLFGKLSVFAGGCTPEAAEDVCDADLDGLQSLVEKSLLRFTDGRYWMLETIREYAGERVRDRSDDADLLRHAEYYVRVAAAAEPELEGADQAKALHVLAAERANFREALRTLREHNASSALLRLATALGRFWYMRGEISEGVKWLDDAVALPSAPLELRARAAHRLSVLLDSAGEYGRAEAVATESLALHRELGQDRLYIALNHLANVLVNLEKYEQAEALHRGALTLARRLEDQRSIGSSLNNLAMLALVRGDERNAADLAAQAVSYVRGADDSHLLCVSLHTCGRAATTVGREAHAASCFREGLLLSLEIGAVEIIAYYLSAIAELTCTRKPLCAARILGSAAALVELSGAVLAPGDRQLVEETRRELDSRLGEGRSGSAYEEGHLLGLNEAVEYALASLD